MIRKGKRGQPQTYRFPLVTAGAADYLTTHIFDIGDVQLSKDNAAFANVGTLPTMVDGRVQVVLDQTEQDAFEVLALRVVDQTGTKVFEDNMFYIDMTEPDGGFRGHVTAVTDNNNFTIDYTAANSELVGWAVMIDDGTNTAFGYVTANTAGALVVAYKQTPSFTVAVNDFVKMTPAFLEASVQATLADDAITSAKFATDAIDASALAADAGTEIAAAVLASVIETNGSISAKQALSLILSATAGTSGGQDTTSPTFSDPGGNVTRIAATLDANKNRTAVTLTPSA